MINNNGILRRIRYVFDFSDSQMISIFHQADFSVTRAEISDWLKKEDDPGCRVCTDSHLAFFLNGLINETRGKKEGGQPEPEKNLSNNAILFKLKIALNLKAEEVLYILSLADATISKHELSAFFRKPGSRQYRKCNDQILRNFLTGLQRKYRPAPDPAAEDPWGGIKPISKTDG